MLTAKVDTCIRVNGLRFGYSNYLVNKFLNG